MKQISDQISKQVLNRALNLPLLQALTHAPGIALRQTRKQIHSLLCLVLPMAVVASATSAHAFINTETIRKQNAGDGLFGNTSGKVTGQSGNTDKLTTNFTTLNIDRGPRDELMFIGTYNYGNSAHIKDTNNAQGMLRYTFFDRQPMAYEVFTQTEYDEFKDLKARNLLGANVRERLISTVETSVYGGVGGFVESEDYSPYGTRKGVRANLYTAFAEKIDERLTGSATVYYQPLFSTPSDYRIRLQADLDVNLTKRLLLNLEYTLNFDSWVPVATVQKADQSYLVGMTVKY